MAVPEAPWSAVALATAFCLKPKAAAPLPHSKALRAYACSVEPQAYAIFRISVFDFRFSIFQFAAIMARLGGRIPSREEPLCIVEIAQDSWQTTPSTALTVASGRYWEAAIANRAGKRRYRERRFA